MRLKQLEADALVAVLGSRVKEREASLYLFGSRANDRLKGGDIDLLVLAPPAVVKALRSEKHFLLAEFKKEIGDQRIDLTLADESKASCDPFIKHALVGAVLLKTWTDRDPSSLTGSGSPVTMTTMAESRLRRQKQESRAAYWRTLSPEKRLKRAAQMTAAGRKLRAAGLALLGISLVRDAAPRPRRK